MVSLAINNLLVVFRLIPFWRFKEMAKKKLCRIALWKKPVNQSVVCLGI
jgi:hypothetical protein